MKHLAQYSVGLSPVATVSFLPCHLFHLQCWQVCSGSGSWVRQGAVCTAKAAVCYADAKRATIRTDDFPLDVHFGKIPGLPWSGGKTGESLVEDRLGHWGSCWDGPPGGGGGWLGLRWWQ